MVLTSGVRGRTRLTQLMARAVRSLQAIPVRFEGTTLYLDLRVTSSPGLLAGAVLEPIGRAVVRRLVREGDVVFDMGAHLGLYPVLFSRFFGRRGGVFAFEPNPRVLSALTRTAGRLGNAVLVPGALSDEAGETRLFVPGDGSMASLADWTQGDHGAVQAVLCHRRRLDDCLARGDVPCPDFIKCDVEGGELAVFRGAQQMLNREDAPILFFEVNINTARGVNQRLTGAIDYLKTLPTPRYRLFTVNPHGDLDEFTSFRADHADVVAIPERRVTVDADRPNSPPRRQP